MAARAGLPNTPSIPGYALPFAAAGYAVFLPNYRGNAGWGQNFARLNIGDPAGAEFAGYSPRHRRLRRRWLCRSRPARRDRRELWRLYDRLGGGDHRPLQGRRHGLRHRQSMELHYSCNHDFSEFIVGGPLSKNRFREIAIDRSPLFRLDKPTAADLDHPWQRGPLHAARPGAGILCGAP